MTSTPDDVKYWVAFSRISRIGSVRAGRLQEHFGSMEVAWRASASELRAAGLDQGTVTNILSARESISPDAEMEALRRAGVKAYAWTDDAYPVRLKEVDDKPPVLYVRGNLEP